MVKVAGNNNISTAKSGKLLSSIFFFYFIHEDWSWHHDNLANTPNSFNAMATLQISRCWPSVPGEGQVTWITVGLDTGPGSVPWDLNSFCFLSECHVINVQTWLQLARIYVLGVSMETNGIAVWLRLLIDPPHCTITVYWMQRHC